MQVQLLIAAVAMGACLGRPVKLEPRKFVFQIGYPSVRRYPVYPDRHLDLDPSHMPVENEANINELPPFIAKKPDAMPTVKPVMIAKEPAVEFMAGREEEETSTVSLLPVEPALTTTSRPEATPSDSLFKETPATLDSSMSLSSTFQPSTFQSESSVSSSSSVSTASTSPAHFILPSDSVTPANLPVAPSSPMDFFNEVMNSVFTSGFLSSTSEEPTSPRELLPSIFTGPPQESTDSPMTTDLPGNELTEEEERMTDHTIPPPPPQEEEEEEGEELQESITDASLADQTATEAPWEEDPVTQEVIFTTEEIETF